MLADDTTARLLENAKALALRVRSSVRGVALILPGVPLLPSLGQAVVLRQVECLESAVVLAEAGRGYSGLPFVRPACEELIWLTYLTQLDREDAESIIGHFTTQQVFESLRAQEAFAGPEETAAVGLAGMRDRYHNAIAGQQAARSQLAHRLGWKKQAAEAGRLPSTRFVAEAVNETRLYDFLYGASSRHVHFNVAELMRRLWGQDGVYEVGSTTFSRYFTAFTLGWCSHLLSRSVFSLSTTLPGTVARFCGAGGAIDLSPPEFVPIITADELRN